MDFPREVSELLEVEVVLEVDVNWSQFLCHITLLASADQLQRNAITYKNIYSLVTRGSTAKPYVADVKDNLFVSASVHASLSSQTISHPPEK